MPTVKIRIANPEIAHEELNKIQDFYRENWNNLNRERDPIELMRAISDNKAYIIEDLFNKRIVGLSFSFSINDCEYIESGGTRIILEGYRLQRLVSRVKIMHEFMRDPPEKEYYTIIRNSNIKSISNMTSVGFVPWSPDQQLLNLIGGQIEKDKSFYRLRREDLPSVRDALLDVVERPILEGKPPLDPVSVVFDIGIIRDRRLTRDTEF